MIKNWLQRLSQTAYVQKAITEQADLAIFKQKPSSRTVWGLITIGISYTVGWPLIAILGALAMYWERPLWLVIGGPLIYGLSHLVFILGAYLAGAEYAKGFLRWALRVGMQKVLGDNLKVTHLPEPTKGNPNKD